jgi:hypothetical protein
LGRVKAKHGIAFGGSISNVLHSKTKDHGSERSIEEVKYQYLEEGVEG